MDTARKLDYINQNGNKSEEETYNELKEYFGKRKNKNVVVSMDVGASNTRIVTRFSRSSEEVHDVKIKVSAHHSEKFSEHLNRFGEILKQNSITLEGIVFAVAGPGNKKDRFCISNYKKDSKEEDEEKAKTVIFNEIENFPFPKDKTFVLNDVEANSYGILSMDKKYLSDLFSKDLFGSGAFPELNKNLSYLIINVGTGLGNCLLVGTGNDHFVFKMENGHNDAHVPYFHKSDQSSERKFEENLLHFIQYERKGGISPEVEDFVSGQAALINYYYGFIQHGSEFIGKEKIEALKNDKQFQNFSAEKMKTEKDFVKNFLTKYDFVAKFLWKKTLYYCQQLCVTMPKVGGIFLCGNNVSQEETYQLFEKNKEEFTKVFKDNKRNVVNWIQDVRLYIQKPRASTVNFNVLGCFDYLEKH